MLREIILFVSQYTKVNRWNPCSHNPLQQQTNTPAANVEHASCSILLLQLVCLVSHPCSLPPPWCWGQPAVCWLFSTLDSTTCRLQPPQWGVSETTVYQANLHSGVNQLQTRLLRPDPLHLLTTETNRNSNSLSSNSLRKQDTLTRVLY